MIKTGYNWLFLGIKHSINGVRAMAISEISGYF
jgi:hypothetical protein